MIKPFFAKSNKETLQQHIYNILNQLCILRNLYSDKIKYFNENLLYYSCLYHDLGKINSKFQVKVNNSIFKDYFKNDIEIKHEYFSCSFIDKETMKNIFSEEELKVLYQSIYYGHNRIKNLGNEELRTMKRYIKEDLSKNLKYFYIDIDINRNLNTSFNKYVKEKIKRYDVSENTFYLYVVNKGLLKRLDYAASGYIDVEIENKDLEDKTLLFLKNKFNTLNPIQSYMLENQDKNNIIIGSTGFGKMEAALLWVGNNKGFFTLPLTSSINCIYDRVIQNLNFLDVSILHSQTLYEYLLRNDNNIENKYNQTKSLSYPLCITTLDQLINFIFRGKDYDLKLSTLSYSKLIIDEIQMYSPQILGYLICALVEISIVKGKFSIITATFPPFLYDMLKEFNIDVEPPKYFLNDIIRHKISIKNIEINSEDIINSYNKDKKILIVVNTVKKAQELYLELIDKIDNLNLYHSRFIKKDLKNKEHEIIFFGNKDNKNSGIWITTQIAENSLDIDFDLLFTELSELTSLFQRMGRIFRNRILNLPQPNIIVYTEYISGINSNYDISVVDKEIFELSKNELMKYNNKEIKEQDKIDMINNIYNTDNIKNTDYYKQIRQTIKDTKNIREYNICTNESLRNEIKNVTVIPKKIYENNKSSINSSLLKYKETEDFIEKEKYKMEILKYSVELPVYIKDKVEVIKKITFNISNSIDVIDIDYTKELGCFINKNKS